MKFTIGFELSPAAPFGVPEDGKTVLPATIREEVSDSYHVSTMSRVEHGTLSVYRPTHQAVEQPLALDECQGVIRDNFVFMQTEAESHKEAYDKLTAKLDVFLQQLALETQRTFSFQPLYLESADGKTHPLPRSMTFFSVTKYNLDQLKEAIKSAESFASISNPQLDRAIQYFEHAIYLYERRAEFADQQSRHFLYLISAIFLNIWKAVSTIVGDPSVDTDYQRRYKHLGFDHDFFSTKIERLRGLRNRYDVAHYHLSGGNKSGRAKLWRGPLDCDRSLETIP